MSTVRADNVGPAAGGTTRALVRGVAAAWANLNGTGAIAVRDSQNVSSFTDNGTGDYTKNVTNALANGNYAGLVSTSVDNALTTLFAQIATNGSYGIVAPTGTALRMITTTRASAVNTDSPYVQTELLGSLA